MFLCRESTDGRAFIIIISCCVVLNLHPTKVRSGNIFFVFSFPPLLIRRTITKSHFLLVVLIYFKVWNSKDCGGRAINRTIRLLLFRIRRIMGFFFFFLIWYEDNSLVQIFAGVCIYDWLEGVIFLICCGSFLYNENIDQLLFHIS